VGGGSVVIDGPSIATVERLLGAAGVGMADLVEALAVPRPCHFDERHPAGWPGPHTLDLGGATVPSTERLLGAALAGVLAGSGLVVAAASPATAFCRTDKSTWESPENERGMGMNPDLPTAMRPALERGVAQWNRGGSVLRYAVPDYNGAHLLFRFHGDFRDTSSLGPAPAYGLTQTSGTHDLASLLLSDAFTWIDGSQNITGGIADTQTVVVHEMGHITGLAHPDPGPCRDGSAYTTAEQGSVMTTINTGTRRTLNSDDVAGVESIY
jgi:hypothetical protein